MTKCRRILTASLFTCWLCCGTTLLAAEKPRQQAGGSGATAQHTDGATKVAPGSAATGAHNPSQMPSAQDKKNATVPVAPPAGGIAGAPGGADECAGAPSIGDGTYPYDTTGATNSAEAYPCGLGGPDLWWCWTASCDGLATVTTCSDIGTLDTVLAVYSGCCNTGLGAVVACNDDGPPTCAVIGSPFSESTAQFIVTSGQTYTIRVWGYNNATGSGEMSVSCEATAPCQECPPGGIQEGEPDCADEYVDATNGGCNSVPAVFSSASCGDTICGTTGTYLFQGLQYRDTDWYEFCTAGGDVTVSATGNFPVRLFILDAACPPTIIATNAGTVPCQEVSVTAFGLAAGTYRFFVGADVFAGVPCGTPYVATLTCTAATGGRCCFADGSCQPANDEASCLNAGGTLFTCGATCDSPCPPPPSENDECANAIAIGDGTFPFNNSAATLSPEPVPCGLGGADLWYCYTATCDGLATATTCNGGVAGLDTVLAVYDGCCTTGGLGANLGCNDDGPPACPAPGGFSGSTVSFLVTAGQSYSIRVWGYNFALGSGDLTLSCLETEPCPDCPPGAFNENEPECADEYVDSTNGGCNSIPNVFQQVDCGDTVCGTSGTYLFQGLQYRDTDWFEFCTAGGDVTVTATAPFNCRLFILDAACPPAILATNASTVPCVPVSVTAFGLAPGRYRFFVGPDVFAGVACGSPYVATLECAPGSGGGACCLPEFQCQLVNSEVECDNLGGTFLCAADCSACPLPPPTNEDCASAEALTLPAAVVGDTSQAGASNVISCSGVSQASPDVWYSVAGDGSSITASLCGSAYDTAIDIYCGSCDNLTCVAGVDDFCGLQSQVTWCSQAGATYYIRVSGFFGAVGTFTLNVSSDGVPCVASIQCLPQGACCTQDGCFITTEVGCEGDYQGDGSTCGGLEYVEASCDGGFVDISGSGTDVGVHCDDCSATVNLPFNFPFFGNSYSSILVHSNGYIEMPPGAGFSDFSNDPNMPNTNTPNNIIAVAWDDFYLANQGTIYAQTFTSPDRVVVQWNDIEQYFDQGDHNTFEAILFADGSIEFHRSFMTVQAADDVTTGIENSDGTAGLELESLDQGGDCRRISAEQVGNPCEGGQCAGQVLADANCDGVVNNFDIDCFVLALTNPSAWAAQCSNGGACTLECVADTNGDTLVNNFDIDSFVTCIINQGCP